MSSERRTLREIAKDCGFSTADVAFLSGLAESTISRLWDHDDWLGRVRGASLQTLIAVVPGLGAYVCELALSTRRTHLIERLGTHGLVVDQRAFSALVTSGRIAEQDLATALEAATHVMHGDLRRATAHLARFWGLNQDHALGFLFASTAADGLLTDRTPLIEASVAVVDRLAGRPHSFHGMIAQANLSHQVAKATGLAPATSRRLPAGRQAAFNFRSTTMGLIIETNDIDTARRYRREVERNSVLALVEGWTFPAYTGDARPTSDLSVPRSLLLRRTAGEILREIHLYNDAYLEYLLTIAIPVVLRRDPTFGLRADELKVAVEQRMSRAAARVSAARALVNSLTETPDAHI